MDVMLRCEVVQGPVTIFHRSGAYKSELLRGGWLSTGSANIGYSSRFSATVWVPHLLTFLRGCYEKARYRHS